MVDIRAAAAWAAGESAGRLPASRGRDPRPHKPRHDVLCMHLFKRLEPHEGGFILRISAAEARELELSAGAELMVELSPSHTAEDLLRR